MHAPQTPHIRRWLVRWMYAAAVAHLLVGVLLSWCSNASLLATYHHGIETAFWGHAAPVAARDQQVWWISLFGATMQSLALWMLALVHMGDQHRRASTWGWLMVGLLVWAPQDIAISLQADAWPHVILDLLALAAMLPALAWLYWHDAHTTPAPSTAQERHHV